jgi:capsular exopolysaccharide synthesis family protein
VTRLVEALQRAAELDGLEPAQTRQAAPHNAANTALRPTVAEYVETPPPGDGADARLEVFQGYGMQADGKLVVMPTVPAAAVEQYRRLAASLHYTRLEKNTKVVMVTSASPGEGKTLTSTNLALTLSQSYRRRVLLIDADLRRPSIHQIFKVPNVLGLSDALKSNEDEKLSVVEVSEFLTVLPAGRPDPDPMSSLTSERMARILREAAAHYDWVLIDTPPVGFLSDAKLLVAKVDVAVFVVRAGKSPYRLIQRALDAVGRNRIMGVVLNAVDENIDVAGYYYYGYYGSPNRETHDA